MAYEIRGTVIVDDNRNIVGANTYNGYVPVNPNLTISAGNGMNGGGSLSSNLSFTIRAGNGLIANTSGLHVAPGNGLIANNTNLTVDTVYFNERYTNYANVNSFSNTQTFEQAMGATANAHFAFAYGHSQGASPTDAPIAQQSNGLYLKNPWRYSQIHFTPGNRIFTRSDSDWAELWHSGNLPNPALNSTIIATGNGLSGGGNLTANRTLAVVGGAGIVSNASGVHVAAGDGLAVNSSSLSVANTIARVTYVDSTANTIAGRTIATGNGLTGGGNLTANRTLSVVAGAGLTANSTGVHVVAGAGLVTNSTHVYIQTGNGMTANSTHLFVNAGDGIVVSSTGVAVDSTVVRNNTSQVINGDISVRANENVATTHIWMRNNDSSIRGLIYAGAADSSMIIRPYNSNGLGGSYNFIFNSNGRFTTASISGDGSALTSLPAEQLTGTINDARIASTIARSAITISPGNGLTGGGNLTANRTLAVGQGNGISVNSTAVSVNAGNGMASESSGIRVVGGNGLAVNTTGVHVVTSGGLSTNSTHVFVNTGNGLTNNTTHLSVVSGDGVTFNASGGVSVDSSVVRTGLTITTTNGLAGGGNLSSNRTLSVVAGNGLLANSTGVHVNTGPGLTANATHVFVNTIGVGFIIGGTGLAIDFARVVGTGRNIIAGNGLSGGGNLTNDRTIHVNPGTGLVTNSTHVYIQTGNGLGSNSTHLFVNAGNGLTSEADGIRLGNPGSITATSTNSVSSSSHTHAITEGTIRSLISDGPVGGIGTYAMLRQDGGATQRGDTRAGSGMTYSACSGRTSHDGFFGSSRPGGTWMCMGVASAYSGNNDGGGNTTLWMRVS